MQNTPHTVTKNSIHHYETSGGALILILIWIIILFMKDEQNRGE